MDQGTIDSILNLIEKSKRVLLLTHAKADCDGLGAMLSLSLILKELGKDVTAVTSDPAPENLAFLPSISLVQNSLASSRDFIITLDVSKTPISKIKYNLENDHQVNIVVSPKSGAFSQQDVSFSEGGEKFDLIIVLDAGSLDHLGPIYDKNTALFFETPVINIDHHASNTDFGQINLVDVVAASATEVLYSVLKRMEEKTGRKLITEDIATLLLAGIITDTGSFQHANTSPRSMEVSAELLDLGARQQEIIKNIYKTKKLSTLKLWGIVLSKVQVDPLYRMVWSTITKDDLQEADASSAESETIIDDLLTNAPGAEVILLIKHNDEGYVSVSMRSMTNSIDVGKICTEMGGGGHTRAAGYKIRDGQPFDQIVSTILQKVRAVQAARLNIHPETEVTVPAQAPKAAMQPLSAENPPKDPASMKTTYLDFRAPETASISPVPAPAAVQSAPSAAPAETSVQASSPEISAPVSAIPSDLKEIPAAESALPAKEDTVTLSDVKPKTPPAPVKKPVPAVLSRPQTAARPPMTGKPAPRETPPPASAPARKPAPVSPPETPAPAAPAQSSAATPETSAPLPPVSVMPEAPAVSSSESSSASAVSPVSAETPSAENGTPAEGASLPDWLKNE